MKNTLELLITVLLFTSLISCTGPTGPAEKDISLSIETACTEAWLSLSVNNVPLPQKVTVTRNGNTLFNFTLTTRDITLYDSTLAPNRTYTYQAVLTDNQISGSRVIVTTLDTTSHNFNWQLFTLGDISTGYSSELRDVVIINDTLAYVVGTFYLNDSTDPQPYCLAKWDGQKWTYKRLYYKDKDYLGNDFTMVISNVQGILAFNNTDIWLAAGSIFHWNGKDSSVEFSYKILTPSGLLPAIKRLCGTSNINMYGVGSSGTIVHYTNGNWQKIDSGTSYELSDIYSNDGKNIYAVGGSFSNYNGVLLKGGSAGFQIIKEGKNINTEQLFHPYFSGIAKTVWVTNKDAIYFGGNLLYRYKSNNLDLVKSLPGNYLKGNVNGEYWGFISQVRGNKENDIIMVGEGNTIRHFNGVTWQQLGMPYNYSSEFTWLSVAMKNNLIITVGRFGRQAIIMVLKR